jgi:bifunctional non-homologous end joining protein LigD
VIICGYTRKTDSDRLFSSLVLGTVKNNQVIFIGQAGTGFSADLQKELMKEMKTRVQKKAPFEKTPAISDPVVWLRPELVGEVKYTELTKEGVMRHASFQGLRPDKQIADLNTSEPCLLMLKRKINRQKKSSEQGQKNKVIQLDGQELRLTNLNKIFWPKEGYTKGNLIDYYLRIAEYIMPYMKDRPQSLNRFPDGIEGESFYHKNMGGKVDKWLKTFERFSDSSGEPKNFLICTNTASLIYMVNLACIELNPWHSRVQKPGFPDWCVIDLDPGKIAFSKVIETARVVKEVLDTLQVPSFPKTSGSTGIHIYIPLGGKYNYEQSRQLAELIARLVHEELPSFTSLVRNPAQRTDKIYIDYLQNRPIQTICAPYSVRPKPGATVSAPLHWEEVNKGLSIGKFTMKNMLERVTSEGDLFKGVLGKGIDLNRLLQALAGIV